MNNDRNTVKLPYEDKNAIHQTYTVKSGYQLRCPTCDFGLYGNERFCPYCGQRFVAIEDKTDHGY